MAPSTTIGYPSTVHKVLGIPEILELIMTFLDDTSNANNARVCRKWSDVALNLIWRDVPDVLPLFQLLGPLGESESEPRYQPKFRHFMTKLGALDWERFSRYSRRVRSLTYDSFENADARKIMAPSAFDEVARTRPTMNILPNLRKLAWWTLNTDRMRLSLMFMHERITQFSVYLIREDAYPLNMYFQEVVMRMPQITHLDLRFDFPVREIESDLADLLRGLRKLKQVIVPLYSLTSKVVEELSKLPHVGVIQFEFMDSQGHGDVEDIVHFAPTLEDGAFPALWDLSLSASLPYVTTFLNNSYGPIHLTSLYVHVVTEAEADEVTRFLSAIAENCQLLTHLYIDYMKATSFGEIDGQTSPGRLTWDALRPILNLPNLVAFELRWDRPIRMTQAETEELASKWPSLEILLLNCEPIDPSEEATLTLNALIPFARHCPNLRELGLYVSASDVDATHAMSLGSSIKPFQNLKRLCMGLSSISDPGPVALFLSHLCPPACELTSGVTWPEGFGMAETSTNRNTLDELQGRAGQWWEKWAEAAKVLPLLTQLRMEERETRLALQREVEDLRMRCRLLSERAGVNMRADDSCVVL